MRWVQPTVFRRATCVAVGKQDKSVCFASPPRQCSCSRTRFACCNWAAPLCRTTHSNCGTSVAQASRGMMFGALLKNWMEVSWGGGNGGGGGAGGRGRGGRGGNGGAGG